jgi:hypothetical protein
VESLVVRAGPLVEQVPQREREVGGIPMERTVVEIEDADCILPPD